MKSRFPLSKAMKNDSLQVNLTQTFEDITDNRWVKQVPLRDGDDALLVNWCELTTTDDNGKALESNLHSVQEDNAMLN